MTEARRQIRIKIETYWNVNNAVYVPRHLAKIIKIETYWNVNGHSRENMEMRKTY